MWVNMYARRMVASLYSRRWLPVYQRVASTPAAKRPMTFVHPHGT
jgi:hypothetical protein